MIRNYAIVLFCLLISSCSNKYHKFESNYTSFTSNKGEPDYSDMGSWAAHPDKWDPSDSIPFPLRNSFQKDTSVDIFFIHPTTYTDNKKIFGWNAPIDNAALNAKTDYTTILFQASVFNESGRIYSPRYRQAALQCYFPKSANDSAQALSAFELAYRDVKNAFEYYLKYYNHGRPFVIASHSQGTNHAQRLLKELVDGKELSKQLVAAYLVGMPLDPGYFTAIKPCLKPDQTGCACSWRTYQQGYQPEYILNEKFISVVTNPLTWDISKPIADRDLNKGGLLLNFNKIVPRVSNATIGDKVLWTDKPHFFGNIFYTTKNYHVADMNLFYLSIRENVKERISSYLKKRALQPAGPI